MKNPFRSLSLLAVVVLIATACERAELPEPQGQTETAEKKGAASGGSQAAAVTYGGRATGIDALIWNMGPASVTSTQYYFAYTSSLPAAGGTEASAEALAVVPDVLTADSVEASVTGQNNTTIAVASMNNLNLSVGGHTITASSVQASASAACGPVRSGASQFTSLIINGNPVTVTGAPNQAIFFPNGGMIIINEQSQSKKNGIATINVTAIHVILPNVADIKLATAKAEIKG